MIANIWTGQFYRLFEVEMPMYQVFYNFVLFKFYTDRIWQYNMQL